MVISPILLHQHAKNVFNHVLTVKLLCNATYVTLDIF